MNSYNFNTLCPTFFLSNLDTLLRHCECARFYTLQMYRSAELKNYLPNTKTFFIFAVK